MHFFVRLLSNEEKDINQALFDAHFKISITSQLSRMNGSSYGVPGGGGGSFEPFAGAHFQGDCKSKMMQLLYGDVTRSGIRLECIKLSKNAARK